MSEIWSKPQHDAHVALYKWFTRDSHKDDAHIHAWRKHLKPWLGLPSRVDQARIRYQNDPVFRQREKDRTNNRGRTSYHIRMGFLGDDYHRTKAEQEIGYSLNRLRTHLESLMPDGMTWDQYLDAKVVIDHIRPVSTFDMKDREQFLKCWALDNLQPLTEWDNQAKRSQDVRWRQAAE